MAILLKEYNPDIECVIYEIREQHTTWGGALNFRCNGLRVLDKLGVYQDILSVAAETNEFDFYSANGSHIGVLPMGHLHKRKYGYGCMRILRSLLHEKIMAKATQAGITVHMGKRLSTIDETEDSVKVTFEDGTTETGDILVGADGIHSVVRTKHVQPSLEPTYTGLSSLYSLVPTSTLQSPLYFNDNFGAIMLSSGLFATGFYDKERQHMYWFNTHEVASRDRDGWTAHGKESEIIKAEVLERTRNITIPLVREIVESSPDIKFYPIYTLPSGGKCHTGRTLLIGDAAHGTPPSVFDLMIAMPPHIGQGTSMALEDTVLLARLLAEKTDIATVFQKFDKIRRPRIETFFKYAQTSGNLRRETGPWGQWLKEWGMWLFLKITPEWWSSVPFEYDVITVSLETPK